MLTYPAPHEGLGVAQYAWSTSPLRRYVDLVNQWQILAVAQHGITAKLVIVALVLWRLAAGEGF